MFVWKCYWEYVGDIVSTFVIERASNKPIELLIVKQVLLNKWNRQKLFGRSRKKASILSWRKKTLQLHKHSRNHNCCLQHWFRLKIDLISPNISDPSYYLHTLNKHYSFKNILSWVIANTMQRSICHEMVSLPLTNIWGTFESIGAAPCFTTQPKWIAVLYCAFFITTSDYITIK